MAYFKVTIEVLLDVASVGEACDAVAEAIRPMLREFKPEYPTAWIDWRYADRGGYPQPCDGAGFEYVA